MGCFLDIYFTPPDLTIIDTSTSGFTYTLYNLIKPLTNKDLNTYSFKFLHVVFSHLANLIHSLKGQKISTEHKWLLYIFDKMLLFKQNLPCNSDQLQSLIYSHFFQIAMWKYSEYKKDDSEGFDL